MGFWDKVKSWFSGKKQSEPGPARDESDFSDVVDADDENDGGGALAAGGVSAAKSQSPQPQSAPAKKKPAGNPYENTEILALPPDEMRKRALKINPYKTPWIGRTDLIPPQADERTALIDRGLILRGLLTREQIAEIHRVGDLWLKHHEAASLAQVRAAKTADEAIEQLKRQRAERKKEKQRLAAEKESAHAAAVAKRRAEDIVYLGRGVSHGLADRRSHVEKLAESNLPVLATPADVAKAMGIAIPKLRWLCFHAEATERTHYVTFEIPKRSGGTRLLAAPMPELANAQRWIFDNVLGKPALEAEAHGFVRGRSTLTNATPHLGRDVVVNLDLESFFPTITFQRVRGLFESLGYSPAVATIFGLLCTTAPRRTVEFEGIKYQVAVGEPALPQGACTSPALSNLISRKLDRRLRGMCAKHGFVYTRYADDLTFSAPAGKRGEVPMFLARVRHIIDDEGFRINLRKGRVQRRGGRQVVTGIVVNEKPAVPREEVRQLRAILHNAKKTGLAAQNRDNHPHFEAWLRGKIAYVSMIDRARGEALGRDLDGLLQSN